MTLVQSSKRDRPWKRGQREAQLEVQRKLDSFQVKWELLGVGGKHQAKKLGERDLNYLNYEKWLGSDLTNESTMEMWPFWIVGDLSHEKIGIWRENDHILQMLAK
jgi:hypothetical protein